MLPSYKFKNLIFENRGKLFQYILDNEILNFNKYDIECIYEPHSIYNFKRNENYGDLFLLSKRRLEELKSKGKKITLWYSGGIDSHFILHCMKKHNIWCDRICIYFWDNMNGKPDEIYIKETYEAIKQLYSYDIPKHVEIKIPTITQSIFDNMLTMQEYIFKSSVHAYSCEVIVKLWSELVGCELYNKDHINLRGSVTPLLSYEKEWGYKFIDYQLGNEFNDSEMFITDSDYFLESYLNNIINNIEAKIGKNKNFLEILSRESERYFKLMSNEMKIINEEIFQPQFDKRDKRGYKTNIPIVDLVLGFSGTKFIDQCIKGKKLNSKWYNDFINILEINKNLITLDLTTGPLSSKRKLIT